MKIAIYLWVVLSLLAGTLYGQSSGMEGRQWNVVDVVDSGSGASAGTTAYKTEGTVELDGFVYSKVMRAHGMEIQLNNWQELNWLLRRDSLGRIYERSISQSLAEENLLYDFNLELGDIIQPWDWDICTAQVVGIDSVELQNGEMRKRLEFEYLEIYFGPENAFWIEGIGSGHGLEYPLACYFDYISSLLCYYENGEKLYDANPDANCLVTFTTINTEEATAPSLARIFPNPSTGLVFLDTEHTLHQVQLWTAQGALLQTLPGNVREIDLSVYPAGIYFLRLMTKDGEVEVLRMVRN